MYKLDFFIREILWKSVASKPHNSLIVSFLKSLSSQEKERHLTRVAVNMIIPFCPLSLSRKEFIYFSNDDAIKRVRVKNIPTALYDVDIDARRKINERST